MRDVDGRMILITGAAGNLGGVCSRRLAAGGANVALVDFDHPAADALAYRIRAEGGAAEAFACDVTAPEQVAATVDRASQVLGPVYALVNVAGGRFFSVGPAETIPPDAWTRTIAVNLTGTWLCCQAVIPAMKAQGAGRIVNISATMVSMGTAGWAPYVAAKGGVVGLTRALATELGPSGINVNAIAPGMVPPAGADLTDEQRARFEPFMKVALARQPIKRIGTPEDIAAAVAYLISADAGFINGQVWNIDGGVALI